VIQRPGVHAHEAAQRRIVLPRPQMVMARRRVMTLARVQIAVGCGARLRVYVAVCVVVVGIRDGGGATGQQAASAKPIPGRRSGSEQ
jgi:hypothetical protein